jgi:hypothetical protein
VHIMAGIGISRDLILGLSEAFMRSTEAFSRFAIMLDWFWHVLSTISYRDSSAQLFEY